MRPRPRERSLRLRLCGLAPERAERRVSRKRIRTGVVGRARTSPRRGAPLGARRRDLPQILHALSFYSTFTQGTRRRASVAARAARRPGGVRGSGGAGGRRVDPDSTHATALACDTWRFETFARYDTFLGCLLPLAAALADRQTDRYYSTLSTPQSAEGTVFIFESYTYRPTATFAPESKADLLHERRMRERKQGDSNSCPGSSCGKAGRQDCAPVLSLSCTPGRLARLSELTSTFAAGWYAG